jgi:hypothetical protein
MGYRLMATRVRQFFKVAQTNWRKWSKFERFCASAPVAPVPLRTGNWSGAADPLVSGAGI